MSEQVLFAHGSPLKARRSKQKADYESIDSPSTEERY